jgi:nucleotide-binding universal stress UspA family protein
MAIKDLLVAFNDDEGARNALKFGLQMAKKYDAALTGIYAYQPQNYGSSVKHWIPEDVFSNMTQAEVDVGKEIEKAFHAQVMEAGHKGEVHFHIETGQPDMMLARAARYHDLLLVGQFVGALNRQRKAIQPEQLLERAGTPIIVIPANYKVRPFKEQGAVAWDASRSASRALTDAMQILETKKKLDILTVKPDGEEVRHGDMPERDIVTHLKRHGVDAKRVALEAEAFGIGQAILAYCAKSDPDVLVMGAFGRSKFGAVLFGSVTLHILENMNVPLLMSH